MAEATIVIAGAAGRMGQAVIGAAREAGVRIAGALERPGHSAIGGAIDGVAVADRIDLFVNSGGVLIDFTTPSSTIAHARAWEGLPMVVGATGFSASEDAELAQFSKRSAIVKSGNFSLGVNLLAALVRKAASVLGPEYDIEIVESHHRAKRDAPSGTALMLARAGAEGRGALPSATIVTDRKGAREKDAIGVATIRGGGIIGDHDVMFAGASENVTLSHRAIDRGLFAKGAIAAARWVAARPAGLYSMADVLGL